MTTPRYSTSQGAPVKTRPGAGPFQWAPSLLSSPANFPNISDHQDGWRGVCIHGRGVQRADQGAFPPALLLKTTLFTSQRRTGHHRGFCSTAKRGQPCRVSTIEALLFPCWNPSRPRTVALLSKREIEIGLHIELLFYLGKAMCFRWIFAYYWPPKRGLLDLFPFLTK